jgi:hypothetical protein
MGWLQDRQWVVGAIVAAALVLAMAWCGPCGGRC